MEHLGIAMLWKRLRVFSKDSYEGGLLDLLYGLDCNVWPDSLGWAVIDTSERTFLGMFPDPRTAFQYRMFIINEMMNGKRVPLSQSDEPNPYVLCLKCQRSYHEDEEHTCPDDDCLVETEAEEQNICLCLNVYCTLKHVPDHSGSA